MKVQKGKRKRENLLTYEDIKEIIHLISMAFYYILCIYLFM
jgi:hypothetical protein